MKYLVTGGTGFIGAAIVRRLVREGHEVRVLDNNFRGRLGKLGDAVDSVDLIEADIRDANAVDRAAQGIDRVVHLAYVNGTQFFYEMPELVLDVGIRGMLNVIDACRRYDVSELFVASSSEVYQSPTVVPTPETVPLVVPDPLNPRYSYGGGKILVELMALNYGLVGFERVVIFRPHNVYGPDMGWEHVLPQLSLRMKALVDGCSVGPLQFPIQGTGEETRAFNYVDDFVDGLCLLLTHGVHRTIYHIGTPEEYRIADVANMIGAFFGRSISIVPGSAPAGGTSRRCPDIGRLRALGYKPKVPLLAGLPKLVEWYARNADKAPESTFDA